MFCFKKEPPKPKYGKIFLIIFGAVIAAAAALFVLYKFVIARNICCDDCDCCDDVLCDDCDAADDEIETEETEEKPAE